MKYSLILITALIMHCQISLSQEIDNLNSKAIVDFNSSLAGGYFQYGIMLIEQNADRENFKEIIATDIAAIAFTYYILHVEEKTIDKNKVIEFQIREALKLKDVTSAFNDPLAWNAKPPNLPRANINIYRYEWQRERNHDLYQKHIENFISYFSTE